MGTSLSHRSPRTDSWEQVQRLYDDPQASPEAITAQIVEALDTDTRRGMVGPPVAECVRVLTHASVEAERGAGLPVGGELPPPWDLAAALRREAEEEMVRAREASHFGEIGLDALSASAVEIGEQAGGSGDAVHATLARYANERRLSELARLFMAHHMAGVFRYFVERDTPGHVGGPRLATVDDAMRLADDIAGVCAGRTREIALAGYEADLRRAADRGPRAGRALCRGVLDMALREGLRSLRGGDT